MSYTNNYQVLQIPNTLEVIALCWRAAEQEIQQEIKTYYPNSNEEFITRMFHGRFAFALSEASQQQLIANAFLADLRIGFPQLADKAELGQIATGLIAEATLHERKSEAITGGDFGLMIIRPQVTYDNYYLTISDYRRGLLCQAKLKNKEKAWGSFTRNQEKILPERLAYLGLLLYDYEDELRRNLRQFKWYFCGQDSMPQLSKHLKHDSFPYAAESGEILHAIGSGLIGTDDNSTLDEIVSPAGNPSIRITIGWPTGDYPGSSGSHVYVYASEEERQNTFSFNQLLAN